MDYIDYYKVLSVGNKATEKEIKSAYRKLARKYHPDVNPGDAESEKKFKELNEANEVLSHPDKRKKYDKYGKDWKHAEQFEKAEQQQKAYNQQQSSRHAYTGGDSTYEGDFSDFFSSMFGGSTGFSGGQGRSHSLKGQDLTAELQLPLRQAAQTHKQTLTVNGKKIRITIPGGIANGQTIKIKGQGGPGMHGGPKGDLYITFRIDKDPVFERNGDHLYIKNKVDLYTLVLGGSIEVETLYGKVKINIKSGTNPGAKIRLKNKGFPLYKNAHQHGDLIITLDADIPKNLSAKEKELFEELKNLRK